jgi:NAD(P)-dependent dehydrogenase (short-subunit alcohol dehydrogenase family)
MAEQHRDARAQRATRSTHGFPAGTAVVVGGSGGIGRGVCLALAARGCDIALTYRSNEAKANETAKHLRECGVGADPVPMELADLESVTRGFAALGERHPRIHTVVFAAGADISMVHVSNIDPDEWRRTIDGDLNGFYHVIRNALPRLRAGGGGSIVAITSAGVDRHPPMDILSVAPKAGIEALIRGIAREEGRYGIRANSVAPGVIDGGLFDRLKPQVSTEFIEAMKRNTALRRFGSIEEVAEVAAFLASSSAAYVTGQHIAVDGGYSV